MKGEIEKNILKLKGDYLKSTIWLDNGTKFWTKWLIKDRWLKITKLE